MESCDKQFRAHFSSASHSISAQQKLRDLSLWLRGYPGREQTGLSCFLVVLNRNWSLWRNAPVNRADSLLHPQLWWKKRVEEVTKQNKSCRSNKQRETATKGEDSGVRKALRRRVFSCTWAPRKERKLGQAQSKYYGKNSPKCHDCAFEHTWISWFFSLSSSSVIWGLQLKISRGTWIRKR